MTSKLTRSGKNQLHLVIAFACRNGDGVIVVSALQYLGETINK